VESLGSSHPNITDYVTFIIIIIIVAVVVLVIMNNSNNNTIFASLEEIVIFFDDFHCRNRFSITIYSLQNIRSPSGSCHFVIVVQRTCTPHQNTKNKCDWYRIVDCKDLQSKDTDCLKVKIIVKLCQYFRTKIN
jgi:hypothetical protein